MASQFMYGLKAFPHFMGCIALIYMDHLIRLNVICDKELCIDIIKHPHFMILGVDSTIGLLNLTIDIFIDTAYLEYVYDPLLPQGPIGVIQGIICACYC
jgi:hypothetical protein